MKKVLVIGASGLVGSRFSDLAKSYLDITPVDERIVDITDEKSLINYFETHKFDSIVNFAAITNVDGAEKERGDKTGITWRLNVTGPENLSRICSDKNLFLVQISTDFVFKGTQEMPGPYSENAILPSQPDGLSWYGWSKNRAEDAVKNSGSRSAIVRISYPFYSADFPAKLDYAKNYLKLFDEGKLFPIFTDQTLSVLNVDNLTEPLVKIINEELEGTYHIVSHDSTTPFDFVEYLLFKSRNVRGVVQKGSMEDFLSAPGRTPRPRLGGLKTGWTEEKLGMKFMTWREMVDKFTDKMPS